MGDLAFTASVLFINIKLLILELHNKTLVTFVGFLLSIGGWFLWNLILAGVYKRGIGPYTVHGAFIHHFGKMPLWWLTLIMVLIMVIVLELAVTAVRRIFWPQDQDLMQEMENIIGVAGQFGADDTEQGGGYIEEQKVKPSWGWGFSGGFRHWGRRRPSRIVSGDVYMAPPFATTPRCEESADPVNEASTREAKGGKRGTMTSVSEIQPEGSGAWTGEVMAGAASSGSTFVQSPIELQSPGGRQHGS